MSDRVPKITQDEKPTFDAATYSDRLQETRTAAGALAPAQVFDKTKPASIVPLARYVAGKLTDTVNALSEFTAGHEIRILNLRATATDHETRIERLEASRLPFGSASG